MYRFASKIMKDVRELAQYLIKYFERIEREYGGAEVWHKGLITAQEWLRLIDADDVSSTELSAFIGTVHANWERSSGWWDLAGGAYQWVRTKGASVAPPEVFFKIEEVPFTAERDKVTLLEHAHTLLKTFERYCNEDPTGEPWLIGVNFVRRWLKLMDAEKASMAEISELTESGMENSRKYLSRAWLDTELGVWGWCKVIGHSELIPDSLRSMFGKKNG
jgi:hypothetical protein